MPAGASGEALHEQQPSSLLPPAAAQPRSKPRLPWLSTDMQASSVDTVQSESGKTLSEDAADEEGFADGTDSQSPAVSPKPLLNVCVLVVKEDSGYGMTVTGDAPVYVEYVRPDGAAAKAGVQQGDTIAKVNGITVLLSNHLDVVNLIKASSSVALTLLRKPADVSQGQAEVPLLSKSPLRKIITDPIAASAELEQSVAKEKIANLQRMLDQAKEDEERAKTEFARNKTQKNSDKWTEAKKTLESVEQQLLAVTNQFRSGSNVVSNQQGYVALPQEGNCIEHSVPGLEMPGVQSGSVPSASHSAGIQRRFDFKIARRSHSVASIGSGPLPYSPTAVTAAMQTLEEPGHRVIATRMASQNVFMASSADVPDCSVVVLPPPLVVMPSVETSPTSAVSDSGDEGLLRSSSEVKVSSPSYGTAFSAVMKSPLATSSSGPTLCQGQINIISMEDDEFPAEQQTSVKDHGPFNDLEQLKKKHAHCSVFLSYLSSNADPSALLFHLVTDGYMVGSLKEMKKWAYEIYSSFLAIGSPLQVKMDEAVLRTIETSLEKKSDKEDTMRTLFVQARSCCQHEISIDLADFRSKRDLGLGTLFGESELYDGMDRAAEMHETEKLLNKMYSRFRTEATPRGECLCHSLLTLMREWGVKASTAASGGIAAVAVERLPSFLMKDRSSIKDLLSGKVSKGKKEIVKNHAFSPQTYHTAVYCDMCNGILWGVGVQGLQCQACEMNIHRDCLHLVELCLKKRRPRIAPLPRKNTHTLVPTEKEEFPAGLTSPSRKKEEEAAVAAAGTTSDQPSHTVDRLVERFERSNSASPVNVPQPVVVTKPEVDKADRPPASRHVRAKSSVELLDVAVAAVVQPSVATVASASTGLRPGPAVVGRSGSFNDKTSSRSELVQFIKGIRMSRSDVDQDRAAAVEAINMDAARRQETISTLSDRNDPDQSDIPNPSFSAAVAHGQQQTAQQRMSVIGPHPLIVTTQPPTQLQDSDSDVELEMPSIETMIPKEQLRKLKPKEKKRQEIINELFYTERSHVRNLKILDKLFREKMEADSTQADLVKLVFNNISDVIKVHKSMSKAMRRRQKESIVVESVADILLDRFQGKPGDDMKETCAEFCRNRTLALDTLKARRKKDAKLQEIIQAAESSPKCRRLQLYDLLIAEVQRLSKYPLLIHNLVKHTSSGDGSSSDGAGREKEALQEALRLSESVLAYVNSAIADWENQQIMMSLQKRLDVSPVQKSTHKLVANFKHLDLMKHKLIAEGPLTWRMGNRKSINIHAVLLESVLVLLQIHEDGRLVLACQSAITSAAAADLSTAHSPVIPLNTILARHVAIDKKAFFIICTAENGPWIYELVAASVEERKRWFRNITEAADVQRKQGGKTATLAPSAGGSGTMATSNRVETIGADGVIAAAASTEATLADSSRDATGCGYSATVSRLEEGAKASEAGTADGSEKGVALMAALPKELTGHAEERYTDSIDTGRSVTFPASVVLHRLPERQPQQLPSDVDLAQLLYEKDELILRATEEKKRLIASALKLSSGECAGLNLQASKREERDPRVLVLSAMKEAMLATDLLHALASPTVPAEEVGDKGQQLTAVVADLNKRLNTLLDVVVEKDTEVERLRDQLRRANQILSQNADARAESPVRLTPPRASAGVSGASAAGRAHGGSRPSSPSSSSSDSAAPGFITIVCPPAACGDAAEEPTAEHDDSGMTRVVSVPTIQQPGTDDNGSSALPETSAVYSGRNGDGASGRSPVHGQIVVCTASSLSTSSVSTAATAGGGAAVAATCEGGSESWRAADGVRWAQNLPTSDAVAALLCSEDDSEV